MTPLLIATLAILLTVLLVTIVGRWAARRHSERTRRDMEDEERDT